MHFIAFALFGLIIGFIARALMPGRQRLGIILTSVLGMAGSLLGGFLGILLFGGRPGEPLAAGWLGSILGALVLLGIAAGTRRASV
ncbi:MAG TPA: GlsB/YeaQ/YmgE family stress response membrane protein [Polyangiaceae bacterium]